MFLSLWQLKTSVLILNYLCYIFWFHCSQNIHCISLRKSSLLSGLFMSPGNKFVIVSQYIGFQISGSRGLGFESSLRLDSPPVTFKIEYFMGKNDFFLTMFLLFPVIVKANQNIPPLNENTILFLEGRIVLGQVSTCI